jgi:penicillin amidase
MSERAAVAATEPGESAGSDTPGRPPEHLAAAERAPGSRLRRTRYVALALSVLLALTAAGGSWYVRATVDASFPQTSGTLDITGIQGRVEVYRNAQGVPQVYASTAHDLFFAQGFVQAQDRFWQMDVYRHITAGRLSELFGPSRLQTDEFIRTMGWYAVAQQEYKLLSPSGKAALIAYSDGVNAYMKTHSGANASVEYSVLGSQSSYKPYAWTPVDSIAWLKAFAWDLRGNLQDEVDRSLATQTLAVAQVDQLYPSSTRPATSAAGVLPAGAVPAMTHLSELIRDLPSVLAPDAQGVGSGSWVVSGSLTTTGKPLLADDPQLSPQLPSIWYQMGLHCFTVDAACPYDVAGFTMPGTPGVVIGHTESIAWGFADGGADVTDLALEKVTGNTYLYDGRQLPLAEQRETIAVAGGRPVAITVRRTAQGPLVSGAGTEDGSGSGASTGTGYAVALRWTGLSPGRTMDALFELDRAEGWNTFRAAARDFAVPSQTMIFADTAGEIGYQTPGEIPVRKAGDGTWPVPGWTDAYTWTGYVPFDELPHELDPKAGSVLGSDRMAERLERATAHGGKLDAAGMRAIEADDTDEFAATLVPYLEKAPIAPGTRAAAALFRGWDYGTSADSAPAAYFYDVWSFLLKDAFESKLPSCVDVDGGDRWAAVVTGLLSDPTSSWWTDPLLARRKGTAAASPAGQGDRDALLGQAMDQAAQDMTARYGADPAAWRWGTMHTLTPADEALWSGGSGGSTHLALPLPTGWPFDGGSIPVSGGPAVLDAAGFDIEKGFTVDELPSLRMVVDLGDLDRSTWINLTGASGHVGDADYLDQLPLWQEQRTLTWPFSRRAVLAASRYFLVLEP